MSSVISINAGTSPEKSTANKTKNTPKKLSAGVLFQDDYGQLIKYGNTLFYIDPKNKLWQCVDGFPSRMETVFNYDPIYQAPSQSYRIQIYSNLTEDKTYTFVSSTKKISDDIFASMES